MNTGDRIKIFPDTCKSAYIEFIHSKGFACKVYRDHLVVTNPIKPPIDRKATARSITQIRRKHKLSRDDMAELLGVKHETVWNWEIARQVPDKYNQEQLKEKLGWEGIIYG